MCACVPSENICAHVNVSVPASCQIYFQIFFLFVVSANFRCGHAQ